MVSCAHACCITCILQEFAGTFICQSDAVPSDTALLLVATRVVYLDPHKLQLTSSTGRSSLSTRWAPGLHGAWDHMAAGLSHMQGTAASQAPRQLPINSYILPYHCPCATAGAFLCQCDGAGRTGVAAVGRCRMAAKPTKRQRPSQMVIKESVATSPGVLQTHTTAVSQARSARHGRAGGEPPEAGERAAGGRGSRQGDRSVPGGAALPALWTLLVFCRRESQLWVAQAPRRRTCMDMRSLMLVCSGLVLGLARAGAVS